MTKLLVTGKAPPGGSIDFQGFSPIILKFIPPYGAPKGGLHRS